MRALQICAMQCQNTTEQQDSILTYTNTSIERHQNTHELWIAAIGGMGGERGSILVAYGGSPACLPNPPDMQSQAAVQMATFCMNVIHQSHPSAGTRPRTGIMSILIASAGIIPPSGAVCSRKKLWRVMSRRMIAGFSDFRPRVHRSLSRNSPLRRSYTLFWLNTFCRCISRMDKPGGPHSCRISSWPRHKTSAGHR